DGGVWRRTLPSASAVALDLSSRGCRFCRNDVALETLPRMARGALRAEPPDYVPHSRFARRNPQMAVALSGRRRGRNRPYPRGRPRHLVRLLAGRLHADLLVLPHRHPTPGP